jgi:phthalate 4,5-dioxygenase oxygenase subunit
MDRTKNGHVQVFVPVDDEHTMFYGVFFSQNGSTVDEAATRRAHSLEPGVDLDHNWIKRGNESNWYLQDREAMKQGDWTGIKGFTNQDMACQETMGPITDRTQEHLGTSDIAIIRMRRRMLEAVRKFQAGDPLIGRTGDIDWGTVKSEQLIMPKTEPWQSLGTQRVPT